MADYSQAAMLYERSLLITTKASGENHIEVADICNSMGLVQKKLANYDNAAFLYDRAIKIAKDTFKDKPHYKLGNFLHNRADVERKRGNYEEALIMYRQSIEIFDETLGLSHSESADPLHSIGLVLHKQENTTKLSNISTELSKLSPKSFPKIITKSACSC